MKVTKRIFVVIANSEAFEKGMEHLLNSDALALGVTGLIGSGRTFAVTNFLEKAGKPFTQISGPVSAKNLLLTLAAHSSETSVIVIDDIYSMPTKTLYQIDDILCAATGYNYLQPPAERRLFMETAEFSINFIFKGKIIIIF